MGTTSMAEGPAKLMERGSLLQCPAEPNRGCKVAQTKFGSRNRTPTATTQQRAEFMGKPGQDFQEEPRGKKTALGPADHPVLRAKKRINTWAMESPQRRVDTDST